MEVVPQQNGRSALAQLPVKVNGLGQTHSPAGETADLTAQPTEKTLAAECPFQPFQAGSQPFGKSSHSRVPGFRIVRTAASASRIEPKFSPGESTRWDASAVWPVAEEDRTMSTARGVSQYVINNLTEYMWQT